MQGETNEWPLLAASQTPLRFFTGPVLVTDFVTDHLSSRKFDRMRRSSRRLGFHFIVHPVSKYRLLTAIWQLAKIPPSESNAYRIRLFILVRTIKSDTSRIHFTIFDDANRQRLHSRIFRIFRFSMGFDEFHATASSLIWLLGIQP